MDMDHDDFFAHIFTGYGGILSDQGPKKKKQKKKTPDNWFEELNATQCKEIAKAAKLKVSGNKNDIVKRLLDHSFVGRFNGSKSKSTSPEKQDIKRALSAFDIFFKETCEAIDAENDGNPVLTMGDIAQEISTRWESITYEQNARLKSLEKEDKERYEREKKTQKDEIKEAENLSKRQEAEHTNMIMEECKKRLLPVSGTKFDLVLRIVQHEYGTVGISLKPVPKKRKPNRPNPSTIYSRVSKKIKSDEGSKGFPGSLERLMREQLEALKPHIETDPQLVLDGCESVAKGWIDQYHYIKRPGYYRDLPDLAETIVRYADQLRGRVSQQGLERLANIMVDWNHKSLGCFTTGFGEFNCEYDMHEAAHKIRHGEILTYDKAKAKESSPHPLGSMEWYEEANKAGVFKMYYNGKLVKSDDTENNNEPDDAEDEEENKPAAQEHIGEFI